MEKNSQISLQKKTMMESEETALTTECLQILQGKPITGERHMFGFELDTNYERRSVFYQLKRIVRMWANRLYFWLAPESQDPRWIPGNYTIEYCKSPPIAMILLAILAIILFLIDDCRGLLDNTSNPNSIAYYLVYKPERRYQLWRYFTTLFVHTDWSHLGSNLILQIVFGIQLEVAHGWRRVLLVNMPGVLAGTLASSITSPEAKLAGASAGVYCLITFHLICIIVVSIISNTMQFYLYILIKLKCLSSSAKSIFMALS